MPKNSSSDVKNNSKLPHKASNKKRTTNSKSQSNEKEELIEDVEQIDDNAVEYFGSGPQSSAALDPVRDFLIQIGQVPLLNQEEEKRYAIQYEIGTYAQYKLDINNFKTQSEKEDLMAIAEEGKTAADKLVAGNLRLVVSIARKFKGRGMPLQDLIHQGTFGLYRAVVKYDYASGFRFSTYATWWIRQSTMKAIAESARIIKLPVHIVELINKINKTKKRLIVELERTPTNKELAEELDIKVSKLKELMEYDIKPISMNLTTGEDNDIEIADQIADDSDIKQLDEIEERKKEVELKKTLDSLPERERKALIMRYGINSNKTYSLEEISNHFEISKEGARQLVLRAIALLSNKKLKKI